MEEKEDLRIQKTYIALFTAFQELIAEKPFEKITVRELCSRAKTRTATFYSHFSDKYDFFAFMVRRTRQQSVELDRLIATEMEPRDYISHVLQSSFDFLTENEALLHSIYTNTLLAPTVNLLSHEMDLEIQKNFEIMETRGHTLSTDPEILTELFMGAISRISLWWFANKKDISKKELIEKLTDVMLNMLFI